MAYNSSHTGKEIDNAVDQLNNVSNNVELIKNTVNTHSTTIQTHSDKFITIQNSVNNLIANSSQTDRKILNLEGTLESKASADFVNQINEKVNSLATTDTINNIQSQIIVINDEINELNSEKADQTSLNEIRLIANGAVSSLSILSDDVSSHGRSIESHNTKINDLETQTTNLGINMGTLSTVDGQLQVLIESNKASIDNEINGLKQTINNIQTEISSIKQTLNSLSDSLDQEKQTNTNRDTTITNLSNTVQNQSTLITQLQNEIELLKQQQTPPTT